LVNVTAACVVKLKLCATGKEDAAAATLDTSSKNTEEAETLGTRIHLY